MNEKGAEAGAQRGLAGSQLGFGTRALRAGVRPPRVEQQPGSVPIYQSATFDSNDAAELGDILSDRQVGYAYSRLDNPTSVALADAVAELEGAEAGYALASGMAAIHATLLSVLRAGDHVVASRALYGSTHHMLVRIFERLGVTTTFVDASNPREVEAALRPSSRLLYVETISNPTVELADLPAISQLAHDRGLLVAVDNTFASPYLCRPVEHGADVVIESGTKWLAGHSDVLAGVVVGSRELVESVRQVQIDTGGTLAPLSAFLVLRGIATLHVRMERHTETALALARFLESAEGVRRVFYPGLRSHPQWELAQRLLRSGGAMLAFDLADRRAAAAFLDALRLPPRTASLGSVRTVCVHPPSTTHRQLDERQLREAGILPGLVRVSVGLEDAVDLRADFEQALHAARQVLAAQQV